MSRLCRRMLPLALLVIPALLALPVLPLRHRLGQSPRQQGMASRSVGVFISSPEGVSLHTTISTSRPQAVSTRNQNGFGTGWFARTVNSERKF